ncbi:MAG: glycosyl hydrolase family 32, partial [Arthrobacter sp.]
MVFRLSDHWAWDSWLADDGEQYHLFFLRASRALQDPQRRHYRASIGHAVSPDLEDWQLLPDALVAADAPAWDDLATWTGCTVQGKDGRWHLF